MSRIIYNIRDMKGGGIVDNGYTKRIRERVLSLEDGTVFVMSDFADIADTSTIRQSLSRLVQSGILRRILKGVYEKPKYSKLLDEYVAADPEAVANALARSYHWTIAPCGNTALNPTRPNFSNGKYCSIVSKNNGLNDKIINCFFKHFTSFFS